MADVADSWASPPDLVVGMRVEQHPLPGGGIGDYAEANVGHAVPAAQVRTGALTSRALCRQLTTVEDPAWRYQPDITLDYESCPRCEVAARQRRR